jgi:ATP-dependent Clp protease protease subunit
MMRTPILLTIFTAAALPLAAQDNAQPATPEPPAPAPIPAAAAEPKAPVDPEVAKLKKEVERLHLERDKLLAEVAIAEAGLKIELADRRGEMERSKLELEETQATARSQEVGAKKAELELALLESQIAKAEMDATVSRLKKNEEELKAQVTELTYEVQQKDKERERENYADQKPVYLEEPFQGGTLIISDRRIELNGVVNTHTATHVSERINYFNNRSTEYPIFIVIDDSPGGSVMSGYKILKAMESSEAPVYVVVKSYAASMAAVITTLADRSFAYENAILLHHQLSGIVAGNRTELLEEVDETEDWWVRLAKPVADKMGIGLQEFVDRMYEEESTGDWDEFADKAVELKWVDTIVQEIRETSLVKNPDAGKPKVTITPKASMTEDFVDESGMIFSVDERGRPMCILPRLNPKDRWWLHNPDGFYRAP